MSRNEQELSAGMSATQVKNLRSQVGRAAVHVMAALFEQVLLIAINLTNQLTVLFIQLKRSMESDLEKIALPLVLKTGETNRFLREDCNIALDRMVENVSSSRVIAIVTSEPITNKNPVIRTTVSRLLAYITDRSEFKNLKRLYTFLIFNWPLFMLVLGN